MPTNKINLSRCSPTIVLTLTQQRILDSSRVTTPRNRSRVMDQSSHNLSKRPRFQSKEWPNTMLRWALWSRIRKRAAHPFRGSRSSRKSQSTRLQSLATRKMENEVSWALIPSSVHQSEAILPFHLSNKAVSMQQASTGTTPVSEDLRQASRILRTPDYPSILERLNLSLSALRTSSKLVFRSAKSPQPQLPKTLQFKEMVQIPRNTPVSSTCKGSLSVPLKVAMWGLVRSLLPARAVLKAKPWISPWCEIKSLGSMKTML